jgi:hypothetical protein
MRRTLGVLMLAAAMTLSVAACEDVHPAPPAGCGESVILDGQQAVLNQPLHTMPITLTGCVEDKAELFILWTVVDDAGSQYYANRPLSPVAAAGPLQNASYVLRSGPVTDEKKVHLLFVFADADCTLALKRAEATGTIGGDVVGLSFPAGSCDRHIDGGEYQL